MPATGCDDKLLIYSVASDSNTETLIQSYATGAQAPKFVSSTNRVKLVFESCQRSTIAIAKGFQVYASFQGTLPWDVCLRMCNFLYKNNLVQDRIVKTTPCRTARIIQKYHLSNGKMIIMFNYLFPEKSTCQYPHLPI